MTPAMKTNCAVGPPRARENPLSWPAAHCGEVVTETAGNLSESPAVEVEC